MIKCPCNDKDDKLLMIKEEHKSHSLIYKGLTVLDKMFRIKVQDKIK